MAFIAGSWTHVVVNLAARTAGAGITHRPEVVLHAHREDPVLRNTLIAPVLLSFFVAGNALLALKDRAVEFVFGQAIPLVGGHQLPGKGDRILLEVVAEREVSQHLEERVMAASEADIFKVVVFAARAYALLRGRRTPVLALLHSEEDVLELVHPGVCEQQCRIIGRHQRRRVHTAMSFALEKAKEGLARF